MNKAPTRPTNEVIDAMSRDEMVKFYNQIAGSKLVKFGSRSEGIKRIDAAFDKIEAEQKDIVVCKKADKKEKAKAEPKAPKAPKATIDKSKLSPLEQKALDLKGAPAPTTNVRAKKAPKEKIVTDPKILEEAKKYAKKLKADAGKASTSVLRSIVLTYPMLQRREFLGIADLIDAWPATASTQYSMARKQLAAETPVAA